MSPFPLNFHVPKFDKNKGNGDLKEHIREFFSTFIEVSHEDSYLMCPFPRNIGGFHDYHLRLIIDVNWLRNLFIISLTILSMKFQ